MLLAGSEGLDLALQVGGTAGGLLLGEVAVEVVEAEDLQLDLVGGGVEELLAAGCPMDLAEASFPIGGCTRTLFGKAMVMLWRSGPASFRLEVARSFAPYVLALLARAVDEQG